MKLSVAAKALITRKDGKVLIVREASTYKEGTEEGKWDVVGGRIRDDEHILSGLQREIKEESGLVVETGEVLGVAETFPVILDTPMHIIRVYYLCNAIQDTVQLSTDHDRFEWIEPKLYGTFHLMEDLPGIFQKYLNLTHL